MMTGRHLGFATAMALVMGAGCGSSSADSGALPSSSDGSSFFGNGGNSSFPGGNGPFGGQGNSAGGAPVVLPPETETNATFELPHAGTNFVYAANTDSDTVAVIDSRNLAIQIVQAGDKPRFLQTLAHSDAAIVLNVGSNDATIIRTDPQTGTSRTSSVLVKPGSNAIAVADDGKHAVVYFDSSLPSESSTPGNPQDVTVITLDPNGDIYNGMSIGYGPTRVFFSSDSMRAFMVTADGVSILDFAKIDEAAKGVSQQGSGIAQAVEVGKTGIDKTLDVSVTADGRYALAREEGTSELRLVDLETKEIKKLDLAGLLPGEADAGAPDSGSGGNQGSGGAPAGGNDAGTDAGPDAGGDAAPAPSSSNPPPEPPPAPLPAAITDLDLAPSGSFALAVLRERSAVARIPIPGAFADASSISVTVVPGELVGSVALAPDEQHALLYTTVADSVKRVTILNLDGASPPHPVQLRKAIESVAISPDSKTALVLNKKLPGDPAEPGIDDAVRADRQFGYTLLRMEDGFNKLMVTAVRLGPFALVPDSSHLLVLFNDKETGVRQVQNVELVSFQMTPIDLGSPPTSVGAVPASERAFVGQDHPDGRISFIDWATSNIQTVTGFELNSRIRQ